MLHHIPIDVLSNPITYHSLERYLELKRLELLGHMAQSHKQPSFSEQKIIILAELKLAVARKRNLKLAVSLLVLAVLVQLMVTEIGLALARKTKRRASSVLLSVQKKSAEVKNATSDFCRVHLKILNCHT